MQSCHDGRVSSSHSLVRHLKHHAPQPPLEIRVVHELAEQLRVVLHDAHHQPAECPVVLDAGVLAVRILPRVS